MAFFAVLVGLVVTQSANHADEAIVGMGLQVVVVVLMVAELRLPHLARPLGLLAILLFLASVGLLRDGAGTGYGPLILLPIVWSALRGRRGELVLIGGAAYPPVGWRAGSLLVLVGAVTGASVLHLVRQLRASTEHASAILDSMSEGFVLTRDVEIVAVNAALCKMLGMREDELVGMRPPYPFWPSGDESELEAMMGTLMETGGSDFELTMERADGESFPASARCRERRLRQHPPRRHRAARARGGHAPPRRRARRHRRGHARRQPQRPRRGAPDDLRRGHRRHRRFQRRAVGGRPRRRPARHLDPGAPGDLRDDRP
jgi:PAS domain S-box-containing protein